jgi:prefoldin subunit 5
VAFLKGEFRETNEITVALGAEYYAQYTAKDAIGVIDRRLKCINCAINTVMSMF